MAFISREIVIESGADDVWKVIGDFERGPSRMAPGFVIHTKAEGELRVVTFADGTVVTERRISVDDDARRIAYSVVGERVEHDNAVMQVFEDGERCRLVWSRDVLPDALVTPMSQAMEHGIKVVEKTLGNA
ncbi:SRPBCC family protein [Lentzea sp. NPDC005914]|uniref:SRPBCC family protein n=1 Tax=Lentzea sp. NPDC005914 TaxID=3154572 RepID=UPI0033ED23EF